MPDCLASRTSRIPGSLMPGVPASLIRTRSSPESSLSRSSGILERSLWACRETIATRIPRLCSSLRVRRVSSAATPEARSRTAVSRVLTSSRLPIGVAATNKAPASSGAPCPRHLRNRHMITSMPSVVACRLARRSATPPPGRPARFAALAALALVALAACTPADLMRASSEELAALGEQARTLSTAGDHGAARQVYLSMVRRAPPQLRQRYRIMAAREAGREGRNRRALSELPGDRPRRGMDRAMVARGGRERKDGQRRGRSRTKGWRRSIPTGIPTLPATCSEPARNCSLHCSGRPKPCRT